MKLLKLQGKNDLYTMVDDEVYENVKDLKWYPNSFGYPSLLIPPHTKLHRLVINAKKGQIVDHIDRDVLNNQLSNLRFSTASENGANKKIPRGNRSGLQHSNRCYVSDTNARI
jgi:hypothetical protein